MKKSIIIYTITSFLAPFAVYFFQRLCGSVSPYEWYHNQANIDELNHVSYNDIQQYIEQQSSLNFWNLTSLINTIDVWLLGWVILPLIALSLPIVLSKYCSNVRDVVGSIISCSLLLTLFFTTATLGWYGSTQDFNLFWIYGAYTFCYIPILVIEAIFLSFYIRSKQKICN